MTWKRNKDGGLDYDVSQEFKPVFNPCGTAHTMTFNINVEDVPTPSAARQRLQEFKKRKYGK
jgi:hypothetical protein